MILQGGGGGIGGGDQNRRTDFEISVIRPMFHKLKDRNSKTD